MRLSRAKACGTPNGNTLSDLTEDARWGADPEAVGGRVLCVDDDPEVLSAVQMILRRSCEVVGVTSAEEALAALERERFAVLISDMHMPDMDGATYLARTRYLSPNSARILVTGNADLESAMAAINKAYVFRFLTKPFPPDELRAAVHSAMEHYRLVNADRDDLLELVFRDDLTRLYNRRYFDRTLRLEHARCVRHGRSYAVVFFDLDGLKAVNTKHGHLVGSRIIEGAGAVIGQHTRSTDFAFRFGGDEFVTLLLEGDKAAAARYAYAVLEALSKHRIEIPDGSDLYLSASVGIATYPGDGQSELEVLENADRAMYAAKAKKEDRVVVFDESLAVAR